MDVVDRPRDMSSPAKGVDSTSTATFGHPPRPSSSGWDGHDSRVEWRRWDGISRTTLRWDCHRPVGRLRAVRPLDRGLQPLIPSSSVQDPDLWDPHGDCLVYLHGPRQPDKTPSFRLSFEVIRSADCTPLLERFAIWTRVRQPRPPAVPSTPCPSRIAHELYIPPPLGVDGKQAIDHHLGTRNFFAWMFGKPMVGNSLGQALVSLVQRMNRFRSVSHRIPDDVLDYIDHQAYSDFRECPDHALGLLYFAERQRLRTLWTDAFVHCVGMHDRLLSSPAWEVRRSIQKPDDRYRDTDGGHLRLTERRRCTRSRSVKHPKH